MVVDMLLKVYLLVKINLSSSLPAAQSRNLGGWVNAKLTHLPAWEAVNCPHQPESAISGRDAAELSEAGRSHACTWPTP